MKYNHLVSKAVQSALIATAAFAVALPAAYAADEEGVEEVVVTCTRLNTNPNLDSPNPVQTVSAEDIQVRGTVRVEDLVNEFQYLFEDSDGTLWVGIWHGGFAQYHPQTQTFTRYLHDPKVSNSLSNNEVMAITEDNSGKLWIATLGVQNKTHRR